MDKNQRNRVATSLALLAALAGVVIHYRAAAHQAVSAPERWVNAALAPVQMTALRLTDALHNSWEMVQGSARLAAENRRLRRRVAELEARNQELERYYPENHRLRQLLDLKEQLPDTSVAAEVVALSPSPWQRRLTLNRGRNAGVRPGDVVLTHTGLVGQVVRVTGGASTVLLLVDRESGVGARVQRSLYSGVVRGDGGDLCTLEYLENDADVRIGDVIVSSGLGDIYPRGRMIGAVESVSRKHQRLHVVVKPTVNFSRLREVFILRRSPVP